MQSGILIKQRQFALSSSVASREDLTRPQCAQGHGSPPIPKPPLTLMRQWSLIMILFEVLHSRYILNKGSTIDLTEPWLSASTSAA